ncbi:hypothetical protein [Microtetraspora malaysiensis]|uniref:Lipoprotein n=1 Tax=Microtetraspora malaysiensis TaxID=161358 RepID=A0ABW6SHQ1_9ACTN
METVRGRLMRRGDLGRTAAALLVSSVLVGGCGFVDGIGSADRRQKPSATAIQREKEPVLERFPQFGGIASVQWDEVSLGKANSRAPGPTDYRLSGVAQLAKADVKRLKREYDWVPAEQSPAVLKSIKPLVPKGAVWKVSEEFTSTVTRAAYEADFYFDPVAGVMVFNSINAHVAPPA